MSLVFAANLAFAVGNSHYGKTFTRIYLLDRDGIEARDPAALIPVDATRGVGLPPRLRTFATGHNEFLGDPEAARAALKQAGLVEAPIAVLGEEPIELAYATREGGEGIRPQERILHAWRDGRLFIFGRFPGEQDRYLGQADLPDNLRPHFPFFEGKEGLHCAHDPAWVGAWLGTKMDVPQAEA